MKNCLKPFVVSFLIIASGPGFAQDWTGAYGGLTFGQTTFDQVATVGGVPGPRTDERDTSIGGFAGYQVHSGALVYGGEIAVAKASFPPDGVIHISDTDYAYIDLSGRVGYAFGDLLVYGKAGLSHADVTYTGPGVTVGLDGTHFGIGADYALGEALFLGVDYTKRNLDGTTVFSGSTFEISDTSEAYGLRIGYRF